MTSPTYTVVLADDVAALRKLLRLALESGGRFKVLDEAANGREAIAKAGTHHPDLVLLDLSMPEMDGLEALPRILDASPLSRVVVLSGFNHVRMAPVATRLGASGYLEKGLEPDELQRRLLEILEPGATEVRPRATAAPPKAPQGAEATFRVLVLAPRHAERIAGAVQAARHARFHPVLVAGTADAERELAGKAVDIVLVDPNGGPQPAEETLIQVLTAAQSTPVVAIIPQDDADLAARAVRLGVEDCLPMPALGPDTLGRSLLYAMERRRAQEARLVARDQVSELRRLRELEELKTQFFNAAAHELGTPLTPMRLQVHVLRNLSGERPQREVRALEILERNIDRLAKLTRELLDVARLQSGRLQIQKAHVMVRDLVREVHDSLDPYAQSQGVQLKWTCGEEDVDADPKGFVQVLFNLVHNAIKFTPRGGEVTVECTANDKETVVRVHDTGPGLTPNQVARLFRPFSQVLDDQQPPGVGTGLGLFISRGIMELHDGRIWCESSGNLHGATFAFALPRVALVPRARSGPQQGNPPNQATQTLQKAAPLATEPTDRRNPARGHAGA